MRIPFINSANKTDERYVLRKVNEDEMKHALQSAAFKRFRSGMRRVMNIDPKGRD